jgi:hypothetical protein
MAEGLSIAAATASLLGLAIDVLRKATLYNLSDEARVLNASDKNQIQLDLLSLIRTLKDLQDVLFSTAEPQMAAVLRLDTPIAEVSAHLNEISNLYAYQTSKSSRRRLSWTKKPQGAEAASLDLEKLQKTCGFLQKQTAQLRE